MRVGGYGQMRIYECGKNAVCLPVESEVRSTSKQGDPSRENSGAKAALRTLYAVKHTACVEYITHAHKRNVLQNGRQVASQ